jgi:hypothetical protein
MNAALFLQRYIPLTAVYIAGFWTHVPPEQMRRRPHPRVNSIAWNLWHIARCEDAGVARFVADQPQEFDRGAWGRHLMLPWRHHGSEMTLTEVDELSAHIDLTALHAYMLAVHAQTRAVLANLMAYDLDDTLAEAAVRRIVVDEGLAIRHADGFVHNYTGWSKGKFLLTMALTHPFQHVGEMEVIASLCDISFD